MHSSSKLSGQRANCACFHGPSDAPSVQDLVTRCLSSRAPELTLCEPVPQRQRIPAFSGLLLPRYWNAQSGAPLREASLFYASGLLHLLAVPEGVAWAAWVEDAGQAPAWLPGPCLPPVLHPGLRVRSRELWVAGAAIPRGAQRWLQQAKKNEAFQARGTEGAEVDRGLSTARVDGRRIAVQEYWSPSSLVWWKLYLK